MPRRTIEEIKMHMRSNLPAFTTAVDDSVIDQVVTAVALQIQLLEDQIETLTYDVNFCRNESKDLLDFFTKEFLSLPEEEKKRLKKPSLPEE